MLTVLQLANKHRGINKVVSSKKNKEIPSTPSVNVKLKKANHLNVVTNWKEPIDFLKKNQINRDPVKDMQEAFNAIVFSSFSSLDGTNNNNRIPKTGKNKIEINKFSILIIIYYIL